MTWKLSRSLLVCWVLAMPVLSAAEDHPGAAGDGPRVVWVTAEPGVVLGSFEHPDEGRLAMAAGGLGFELFQLRWARFCWSIADVAAFFGPELFGFRLASQPGIPFDFGARKQHHLRVGVGVGLGASSMDVDYEAFGLVVLPTVTYLHETGSGFVVGLRVDTMLHVSGADDGQIVFSVSVPLGVGRP
jgi:hypothetical protein